MNYSIVYSSHTGNTKKLAQIIKEALIHENCLYYGPIEGNPQIPETPYVFVGFWTDKGSCSKELSTFLEGLKGKQVFLFGTAGFGGDKTYFNQIISNVMTHLDASNVIVGSFMCQGKMPISIRNRYEAMLKEHPEDNNLHSLIANFDEALDHPNTEDFNHLVEQIVTLF